MPDSLGIRSIAHLLDTQPRAILVVVGCAFCRRCDIAIREDLEIPMSGDTEQQDVAMDGLGPLKGLSIAGTCFLEADFCCITQTGNGHKAA